MPKVVSFNAGKTDDETVTHAVRKSRSQAITSVARESLQAVQVPLVIDDFHYIAGDAKLDVARAIKTVIPHSKAVLIAVPHEAFDVVRNEPDMGFRVAQLEIQTWSDQELEFIAEQGFAALNIRDERGVGARLAKESYGAPFLMQELCYQYAVVGLRVLQTAPETVAATDPDNWDKFFAAIANRNPPAIFETLLKGPKTRGQQRIPRVFQTGSKTDVYGALLYGVAKIGEAQVSYQRLARVLERDLVEPISGQQITASLGHMSTLADQERGSGDAAIAYKNDDLYVLDPFLLFYLTHGEWSVDKPMTGVED